MDAEEVWWCTAEAHRSITARAQPAARLLGELSPSNPDNFILLGTNFYQHILTLLLNTIRVQVIHG